ncbi:phosphatase PAP2 family protein [Mycobacterium sp. Y57]|nr:phosphatase PAP2 family protein [Mycolicibacterium xanthum]
MWAGCAWHWTWQAELDASMLEPLHRVGAAHPGWVTGWNVFCTVLGPAAFRLATLVVIIGALVRRNVRVALFLIASVELSAVITEIAKASVDRPRPATALVTAYGSSFPSGHALGVTVSVLALLAVVFPVLRPGGRVWAVAVGVTVIVLIGLSRVVLNVHHPSDVIAGWALGYAYAALCLLVVPPLRPVTQSDETPAVADSAR